MHDAIHLVRARITCALEYLARVRTALPNSLLTDSSLAMTGAETSLRQALRDLPDRDTPVDERRREPRRLMENVLLDRGRPAQAPDEPLRLDPTLQFPVNDDSAAAAAAVSWRF
jgi:hypothetical protein